MVSDKVPSVLELTNKMDIVLEECERLRTQHSKNIDRILDLERKLTTVTSQYNRLVEKTKRRGKG